MTGVSIDITERKRAERELERLAQAAEHGTDAVVSIDLEARIRHWNRVRSGLRLQSPRRRSGRACTSLTVFTGEPSDADRAEMLAGEEPYQ